MKSPHPAARTRRAFLRACLTMPAPFLLAACAGDAAGGATPAPAPTAPPPTQAVALATAAPPPAPTTAPAQRAPTQPAITQVAQAPAPTPARGGEDPDVTPGQTEGRCCPPNTPERASLLEPGMTGTKLVVTGVVLTTDCQPVARALLDFWQADDAGVYDNAGYRLRGHQFADDQGRYELETIVPGLYPGRTRHIHVKVQAPNQPVLTTQLYFPGEPSNDRDGIFDSALVMDVQDDAGGKTGAFNFVLSIA